SLEERVYEGRDGGVLRQHHQHRDQAQHHQQGCQPQLLVGFHELPQFLEHGYHWVALLNTSFRSALDLAVAPDREPTTSCRLLPAAPAGRSPSCDAPLPPG